MFYKPVAYNATDLENGGTLEEDLLIRQGSEFIVAISVTGLPTTGNFPWHQGDTVTAIEMHIRQPLGAEEPLVDPWTMSNYISITGTGATREILIRVPYSQLETITLIPPTIGGNQQPQAERTAGSAIYDLELTATRTVGEETTTRRIRLMEGNIGVSRQVTRQVDP